MRKSRVIFMGTPDYAVPALDVLAADKRVEVCLVVTQPDRRQGRGRKLQSPPVKLAADRLQLPVLQVSSLKPLEVRQQLEALEPDLVVVAAFGIILGPKTLNLSRLGCVNLHASLLPAYRGASPIAAAIAAGEEETGVTLMRMDRGLDTGPVLATQSLPIAGTDTTATLTGKLAEVGALLLRDHLGELLAGALVDHAQGPGATLTRPMTKDDGWIDWSLPASVIERHVRAMTPWPRAWSTLPDGTRLQVLQAAVGTQNDAKPGTVFQAESGIGVGTGQGTILLKEILLPGGKPLHDRALVDRLLAAIGDQLGCVGEPEDRIPLVRNVE